MILSGKCLFCKHEEAFDLQNLNVPKNRSKQTNWTWWNIPVMLVSRRQREMNPRGTLGSHPTLFGNLETSERHLSQKMKKVAGT